MARFRLKLDLSQFYDDERNLAYILVDPKWDQVKSLQQHVQTLFDVPEVQFLTTDGIYIPLRESIDVIKSSDVLRAIVPQEMKKTKKKKLQSACNSFGSERSEISLEINGDKRKCDDEGLTCSTPNLRPKKKLKESKKDSSTNEDSSIKEEHSSVIELEESNIQALQNSNTVTSTIEYNGMDKAQQQEVVFAHPNDVSEDTIKSRKRKRTRKNKKSQEKEAKHEKSTRLSSVPIPISSSTLRLSKSMSTPNQSIKHVHFNDGGPTPVAEAPKSKEDCVIYRSLLSIDSDTRVIEAEEVEKDASQLQVEDQNESHRIKPKIQIHEHIILIPAPAEHNELCAQLEQNDCSVIEVDDSILRSEPDDDTVDESSQDISVEKILPLSEELSELPNVGDVILFKMYRLSEGFIPEISKYICGRCEEIDSTNKTLNCLVLDGIDQLDENLPRLTASDENGFKKKGNLNCFQFLINEMLDKRVFRM